jgi:hypothetical protein
MTGIGSERYGLYGLIPPERDVNKPGDFAKQAAEDTGEQLIYETDSMEEARAIYEAGGFERSGVWHVVTRVEDRLKSGGTSRTGSVPRKTDF